MHSKFLLKLMTLTAYSQLPTSLWNITQFILSKVTTHLGLLKKAEEKGDEEAQEKVAADDTRYTPHGTPGSLGGSRKPRPSRRVAF